MAQLSGYDPDDAARAGGQAATANQTAGELVGQRMSKRLGLRLLGADSLKRPIFVAVLLASAAALSASIAFDLSSQGFAVVLATSNAVLQLAAIFGGRALWPIHDLSAWLTSEGRKDWSAATGSPLPMTSRQFRKWLESPEGQEAPATYRAGALAQLRQFEEALVLLSQIPDEAAPDAIADREAIRAQIDFMRTGSDDFEDWRRASARLNARTRLAHAGAMAFLQGARMLADGGPWRDRLLEAYAQVRPFDDRKSAVLQRWGPRIAMPMLMIAWVTLLSVALGALWSW